MVADPWWNPFSWVKGKVLSIVARWGFDAARLATVTNVSCAIAIVNAAYAIYRKHIGMGTAASLVGTCGPAVIMWLA
jgi:hypothetical protein